MTPEGQLLVIGVGGGREIAEAAIMLGWSVIGFLDDNPALHGMDICGVPVLGPCSLADDHPDAMCILTFANYKRPSTRSHFIARTDIDPERWATIIHPRADVSPSASVGRGSAILANAVVGAEAWIGEHVIMLQGSVVSHDCHVGSYSSFASNACLAGLVKTGESCYFGMGCGVRNGLTIGAGAVIGMGAVVVRDVVPGSRVAGNPARPLPETAARPDCTR